MPRALKSICKFLVLAILATIVCTAAWEAVNERLYDCTDAFGFDYWQPGNWVHGHVAVVENVVHHRSMSEPDTIKKGWSVARLWNLWYLFVSLSLAASIVLGCVPWDLRRWWRGRANPAGAGNGGTASPSHFWPGIPAAPDQHRSEAEAR